MFTKSFSCSKSSQYFVHTILYRQHHQNQLVHIPKCLKTTSTVPLQNNVENWKCQVLLSSALSGKIKLWFKHQPNLDSFRHMIFISTSKRRIKDIPTVHVDSHAVTLDFTKHNVSAKGHGL